LKIICTVLKFSCCSKGFRKTLEEFDTEFSNDESSTNISSRTKLIEYLCIQDLYEKNKVNLSEMSYKTEENLKI
jgi:hypothetical protein